MSAIRISNLPASLDASRIQDLFSSAGTIIWIDTQDLAQSGAVEVFFAEPDSAQASLVLHNIAFMGQTLQVSLLEGKEPPPESDRTLQGGQQPPTPPEAAIPQPPPEPEVAIETPKTVSDAIKLVNEFAKPLPAQKLMNQEKSHELQEELSRTIYVGNLNPLIQEDHIRSFFQTCGPVRYIKVLGNAQQHSSRYAFVEFDTAQGAQSSFGLNGRILIDRAVKIGPASNPIFKPSNARRPMFEPQTAYVSTEAIQSFCSVELGTGSGLEKARQAAAALNAKLQVARETEASNNGGGGGDETDNSREDPYKERSDEERDRKRDRDRSRDRSRHRSSRRRRRRRSKHRRSRSDSESSSRSSSRYSRRRSRHRRRSYSRSRSRSRSREVARRRFRDPHEGMLWDGFQWYPKDQVGTHNQNGMPIRPHAAVQRPPTTAIGFLRPPNQHQQQQAQIAQQAAALAVKQQMSRFMQPNQWG